MWTVIAETTSGDFQPQFWVSVIRLAFLVTSGSAMWMLWHSEVLTERKRHAALVAGLVYFLFSVGADLGLAFAGKYKYTFDELLFMGVPLDLHFGYACLWGTGVCLLWENAWTLMKPMLFISVVTLTVFWDRWGLSSGYIFATESSDWQMWNLIVHAALPFISVNFYRLVDENRAIVLRSVVYAMGYFVLFYFMLPAVVLSSSFGRPHFPADKIREMVLLLMLFSLPGAWAAGQFAISGRGTPLPLDPTRKLIVTGPYAYVRNPMQISVVGVTAIWAYVTCSYAMWGYFAILVLGIQLLRIHEEDGLHRRFGDRYKRYSRRVWLWVPKLIPYEDE